MMHDRTESIADLHAAAALSDDERREADVHAASCAPCAALLRDAAEFHRWISGTIAPDSPPPDLDERIIARFRAAAPAKRRPRLRKFFKAAGAIAAAAALIILGTAFTQGFASGSTDLTISQGVSYLTSLERDKPAIDPSSGMTVVDGKTIGLKGVHGSWTYANHGHTYGFTPQGGERNLMRLGAPSSLSLDDANRPPVGIEVHGDGTRSAGLGGNAEEYRSKLAKALNEKSLAVADLAYARQTVDRLQQDLSQLEEKHVDLARDGKHLEEKVSHLNEIGIKTDIAPNQKRQEQNGPGFTTSESALLLKDAALAATPKPEPLQENRKLIRSADLDLEVEAYDAAFTRINALTLEEKGFVAGANTQRLANGKIRATVTIRVPPERFEALLAKFRELGTVRMQNIGSQDVTKAYMDLETRRDSKQALLERLKKLLAEAKGTVKELLEVEVQMGKTIEEIEAMKGELKFYDNQVGLSTIVLTVSEKDLGRPFEYVQTLQSNIGLTVRDPDDAYAKAQKEVTDAGGQVADSRMTRENDGSATGIIKARVDAEKFPDLREALKKLGHVTNDTVNQQKTARGGAQGAPKSDAPLKKEQAVIDLSITTPPIIVTRQARILIETPAVQEAYPAARKAIETAGGKIVNGSLLGQGNRTSAGLEAQLDADRFASLVDQLKALGLVKNAEVKHDLPATGPTGSLPMLRERALIGLTIVSPPELIGEEHGIVKTIRDTFSGSWKGLLWSLEKLFVGISLAGPWIAILLAAWFVWRRVRRRKPLQSAS